MWAWYVYRFNMTNPILHFFGIDTDPMMGIDISSSAVKIMQLGKKNDMVVVEHYGREELTPGLVVEKNIKNPELVKEALNKALKKSKVTTKLACTSVPSSEAITRIIQVSRDLTENEIRNEIEMESDRYIPYAIEEVNLDFEVLGVSNNNPDTLDVLLAASKTENVVSRVELLNDLGITAKIIDINTFAIERAFALVVKHLPDKNERSYIGLIEIGANLTALTVFQNERAIFYKTIAFGGQHLISEIQARYGLSYEEASLARKYGDLPDDYVPEVLLPFKDTVVQQINRICDYFYASGEYKKLDYLFLSGGIANIAGVDELLTRTLMVKTFVANPLSGMLVSAAVNQDILMNDAPMLMGCCGLALRNIM